VAVVLGSLYATRDTTSVAASGVAPYLPEDGSRHVARDGDAIMVSENARLPGSVAAFSMPGKVNIQVITKHGDLIDRGVPMWRQTTTSYGGKPGQSAALFALTSSGLVQLALASEELALVFDPPLVVLPARPGDGKSWTGAGDALGGLIDYRATSTAHRKGSCWAVTGSLTFVNHATSTSMGSVPIDSRLCPGRGVLEYDAAEPPRLTDLGTTPPASSDLARVRTARVLSVVSPSSIGELPLEALRLDVDPVGTADGRLVLADANTGDLVSTRPGKDQLTVTWRAHPGSTITSLSTLGDVVVAGTSDRDLCAYDRDGAWLWCRQLGDVVDRPATALDDHTIAALAQDGVLRAVDLRTGRVRWRARGVDSALPPVRVADVVVAAERSGDLRAWRARTGRAAWSTDGTDVPMTVGTSGTEIVVNGELSNRYDARGQRLSQHVLRMSVSRAVLPGRFTVVSGPDTTQAFDRSGRRLWTAGRWRTVGTDGSALLAVGKDSAELVDPATGEVRQRWPLPRRGGTWWYVRVRDEHLLVNSGGTAVGLS
jgi:hypothetical protein